MVVAAGLTIPEAGTVGDHTYVYGPPVPEDAVAVNEAVLPAQIVALVPAVTVNDEFTVTVATAVEVHPADVPVTV